MVLCRVYLYRHGELIQLSVDDTWIESMTAQGMLTSAEAENHPMRNVLTQAAGSKEQVEVHVHERPLESFDTFLLSSDGLHGVVGHSALQNLLVGMRRQSSEEAAPALVNAALERGTRDNVTAVVVDFGDPTL